nr:hypothetical protein [Tanacetum cinerariifolium]
GLGYESYNAVPPPYTGNFMPLKPDLFYIGLDEFADKPIVENCNAKTSETKPKDVRKINDAPIIEELVSNDEEKEVTQPKIKQKTVKPSIYKIEFVKPKQPEKKARKTVKQGKVPTEMQLVLEQTQQGSSYEVLVSAEDVEELKRKVKIKGEKKKPSLHLGRNRVNTSAVRITKMIAGNGYVKSGQKQSKTDKTRHENEKSSRNRSGRRIHLKSNPVNPLTFKKS